MNHFKTLLQLHSIKLILLSALAIIFLAMTGTYSPNKTDTARAEASTGSVESTGLADIDSGN